jgi:hypothetical protein
VWLKGFGEKEKKLILSRHSCCCLEHLEN